MATTINGAIYELLATARDLPDLVGTRIYPERLPQKGLVYPAIVYHKGGGVRSYSNDGDSGFNRALYQFDVWADTLELAGQVAEKLRLVLSGFRGDGLGISIQGIFCDGEEEGWDDEREKYFVSLDFTVLHNEPNQIEA